MVESLVRLPTLRIQTAVLPGHGQETTIGAERPWLELVRDGGGCRLARPERPRGR